MASNMSKNKSSEHLIMIISQPNTKYFPELSSTETVNNYGQWLFRCNRLQTYNNEVASTNFFQFWRYFEGNETLQFRIWSWNCVSICHESIKSKVKSSNVTAAVKGSVGAELKLVRLVRFHHSLPHQQLLNTTHPFQFVALNQMIWVGWDRSDKL